MTRLSELIEQRGMSIRALAANVAIPERTVYRHVKGQVIPNLTQAAAYARALDVSLDDLVEAVPC